MTWLQKSVSCLFHHQLDFLWVITATRIVLWKSSCPNLNIAAATCYLPLGRWREIFFVAAAIWLVSDHVPIQNMEKDENIRRCQFSHSSYRAARCARGIAFSLAQARCFFGLVRLSDSVNSVDMGREIFVLVLPWEMAHRNRGLPIKNGWIFPWLC